MKPTTEDIKRKVRSLIRLGQSKDAQECQKAISKAYELIRKYRIAEHEVITDIEHTTVLRQAAKTLLLNRSRVEPYHREIANAVANVCGCVVVSQTVSTRNGSVRCMLWAVGVKGEVEICHEMYSWLMSSMQLAWITDSFHRYEHSKDSFYNGFARQMLIRSHEAKKNISEKAMREPQSEEAREAVIIVSDKIVIAEFIEDEFGKVKVTNSTGKEKNRREEQSYKRGMDVAKGMSWKPIKMIKS